MHHVGRKKFFYVIVKSSHQDNGPAVESVQKLLSITSEPFISANYASLRIETT